MRDPGAFLPLLALMKVCVFSTSVTVMFFPIQGAFESGRLYLNRKNIVSTPEGLYSLSHAWVSAATAAIIRTNEILKICTSKECACVRLDCLKGVSGPPELLVPLHVAARRQGSGRIE